MREKDCVHCGETVVVAEQGETVTRGETPIEHMDRTGHAHIREPTPTDCEHCGNFWLYSGGEDGHITCPACRSKTTIGLTASESGD